MLEEELAREQRSPSLSIGAIFVFCTLDLTNMMQAAHRWPHNIVLKGLYFHFLVWVANSFNYGWGPFSIYPRVFFFLFINTTYVPGRKKEKEEALEQQRNIINNRYQGEEKVRFRSISFPSSILVTTTGWRWNDDRASLIQMICQYYCLPFLPENYRLCWISWRSLWQRGRSIAWHQCGWALILF